MTFWTILRWAGAVAFVVIIFVSWLGADHNGASSDRQARPAPIIVR
jgi:hypothetical protein